MEKKAKRDAAAERRATGFAGGAAPVLQDRGSFCIPESITLGPANALAGGKHSAAEPHRATCTSTGSAPHRPHRRRTREGAATAAWSRTKYTAREGFMREPGRGWAGRQSSTTLCHKQGKQKKALWPGPQGARPQRLIRGRQAPVSSGYGLAISIFTKSEPPRYTLGTHS